MAFFKLHLKVKVYLVFNPAFSKWEVRVKGVKNTEFVGSGFRPVGFFFFSFRGLLFKGKESVLLRISRVAN